MAATDLLYATRAAAAGLAGAGSTWSSFYNAVGAPNGIPAINNNPGPRGTGSFPVQRLTLSGYDPHAAVLAKTGGREPFSLDFVHAQVTFTLESASNFDSVDVLLLDAAGNTLATAPLYLADAGNNTGSTAPDGGVLITPTPPGMVLGWVNYTGHNGFDDRQKLTWAELDGAQLAIDVHWSGAAREGATFRVDAVGMFVSFTLDAPVGPVQPPAAVEARAPGDGVSLRVYDRDNNRLGVLPWSKLSTTIVRNAQGALTAEAPKALIAGGLLDGERYLRVAVDGRESPDWYLLSDDGDDDADEGGPLRPVAIGGAGVAGILDWGVVYSWQYDPAHPNLLNLEPTQGFAGKTPGFILASLIDQAKARGCFPHLTYSFTADVDSAGRAWPTIYSRTYDIGTTVLKVLTTMSDDGWVDWEMTSFTLDLYVPDTALAVDRPDLVLRLGKGVTQAPRKRSRTATRSVLLSNGGEGAAVEVADTAAKATWGRREGYEGRSGITDLGTLTAATGVSLARQTSASEALTLALDPYAMPEESPALPRPGGFIRYDQRRLSPTALEPLRVQSIAYDYGDDAKVSVELNDLWVDADIKRGRQLDAILNGSTANERVPVPPDAPDTLAPGKVPAVGLESTAYTGPDGTLLAQMTATWAQVTQNADGSLINDLRNYEIEYKQPDVLPGSQTIATPNVVTLWQWSPVVPGVPISARVRALDRYANPGAWSDWATITAGADVTPPGQPSTPAVDNYLGLLRIRWDGAFADGSPRPSDFRRVEVHLSTLDGFAPDPRPIEDGGTLAGTLIAAGSVFADVPYAQRSYAKLVAVDTTGNRSTVSDQADGVSSQVVSADVFDGAIGTEKLADLAVKSAKIDKLAVNSAQVGTIDVGKLVAGTMTAQVIMAGSISTSASPDTTGGVQINGLGIFAWDPTGGQTVNIDAKTGNATLTGTYRTAFTGRRIEILAAGNTGTVNFYSATGTKQSLSSSSYQGWDSLQLYGGSQAYINLMSNNRVSTFAYRVTNTFRDSFELWQGGDIVSVGQQQRFFLDTQQAGFQFPGGNGGLYIWGGSATISPAVRFFSGADKGQALRGVTPGADYDATNNPNRIENVWWDSSSYQRFWASGYDVKSDASAKEDIVDAPTGMLAKVRATPVRAYWRLDGAPDPRSRSGKARRGSRELGFVAQEAPPELVGGGGNGSDHVIKLYDTIAMHWGATKEQADLHDALAEQVRELAAAVAALTEGKTTT